MRNSLRSDSNSKSLSKLDEEIDKLIEEEINNKKKLKTLSYKEKEKKIEVPNSYSDLKKLFISSYGENEKNSYTFKYIDSEDDENIIEENDEEFESKVSYLKKVNAVNYKIIN